MSKIMLRTSLLFTPLLLPAQDAATQELLALLNTPVTVASSHAMTLRESPGVISYITREEILASGARDLMDLLRMVPGLDFASDTDGVVGMSVRGLWAHEGKVLVLWDGLEMNELLYGNTPFGHRFPVEQLQRVEIIRGPGSAMYGGLAELAVIRLVPLGPDVQSGPGVGFLLGGSNGEATRKAGNIVYGKTWDAAQLSMGGYVDSGLRSGKTFTNSDGTAVDAADSSGIHSRMLHMHFQDGGFTLKGVADDYRVMDPFVVSPDYSERRFDSQNLETRYAWGLGQGMELTPYLGYRRVSSWVTVTPLVEKPRTVERIKSGLAFTWNVNAQWNLALGGEHFQDDASKGKNAPADLVLGPDGQGRVTYKDTAAYFEAGYQGPVNLTLGGRWEDHSASGSAFVPRVAITKLVGDWHFKVLYAQAFRTPNVLNIGNKAAGVGMIEAEKTNTLEGEVGYRLGASALTLNVFRTRLQNPLVYTSLGVVNGPDTGSNGAEMEYKGRMPWGFVQGSFSFNQAQNQVPDWAVPGDSSRFMGLAKEKGTLLASVRLGHGWSVDPNLLYLGSKSGYDWDSNLKSLSIKKFDPELLLGLQVSYHVGVWTTSLGVHDLLNQEQGLPLAYVGDAVPVPTAGREFVARVRYGF